MSSIVQTLRVDDPNDFWFSMMCLGGWRLIDVTCDPHNRNGAVTLTLDVNQLIDSKPTHNHTF